MPIPQFVVDAFTDRPFAGNPAAVVITDGPLDPVGMQSLAAENNIAETAFLHPVDGGWSLRWMTPTIEVDLCGHATLASAHVLFNELGERGDELRFSTRSGWLTARRDDAAIALDLPADPPSPREPVVGLVDALGVTPVSVHCGRSIWLIEVTSVADVLAADPDHRAVRELAIHGTIVTAAADGHSGPADESIDFVSRFFAAGAGIDEDPVTGAAHCVLGPFWAGRLGRTELVGYQASARGGVVRVSVGPDRIGLAGRAVTVARSTLGDSVVALLEIP